LSKNTIFNPGLFWKTINLFHNHHDHLTLIGRGRKYQSDTLK
jgi:hypothetical protein